ncbi:Transcriptional regulatory protein ZraR [Myxococcaceae bacterium]|nr:Transcriptional regulatory protein ZraR [Myxococcaceae bacterium]
MKDPLGVPIRLETLARKRYDAVVSDIQLPDVNGEALFVEAHAAGDGLPPWIFITGYGAIDGAVRMLKLGAEDYLTKPLDIRALLDKLRAVCTRGRPAAAGEPTLGVSSAMRAIEAMLPKIANSAGTVLITGESGVGKEEVARALHRARDAEGTRPFVAVNCGALTETLLEAELFGHVKGSFTGAARDRKGVFEQAHGGTLFLDEIGDMSPAMQVKLLRAIQERQIVRVGGDMPIPVDIRLVCATHHDLKKMVEAGEFREDLYYRIHVIHLHIPPLRERKEDILWLTDRLLARCATESGGVVRRLHRNAEKPMLDYPWPGNIRQLKHVLERACILSTQPVLTPELLFGELPVPLDDEVAESLSDHLHACERRYIESALRANRWRMAETAAALGISRKNLWEKMKKLGIAGEEG